MPLTQKERGTNVRRNLIRWRKRLLALMAGWILLTLAVCVGAVTYAHTNHWSPRRVQMLAEGCGLVLVFILAILWLAILVMADRTRPSDSSSTPRDP